MITFKAKKEQEEVKEKISELGKFALSEKKYYEGKNRGWYKESKE